MDGGNAVIYFDNAATTLQKPPAVYFAVQRAMRTHASVGRGGHAAAELAAQTVFSCREEAAALFDARPEQVVFTMNATHALNLAIGSLVKSGARVVISGFEHNAVVRPLFARGAELLVAGRRLFDSDDLLTSFESFLKTAPDAAVCTHVSNVFGYILPVEQIAALCRAYAVPLIIDASQSAGTIPLSLHATGAAFIAMPGHKGLLGPQGTGILLCAAETTPLILGGTGSNSELAEMPDFLPDRLEAGTHNVCGVAGLLAGLRFVRRQTPSAILRHEQRLSALLRSGLREIPSICPFFGTPQSGVVSFTVRDVDCEEAARRLAREGIAVRAGLHCAPMAHRSAGTFENGTVRVSFSPFNTAEEMRRFLRVSKKLFADGQKA